MELVFSSWQEITLTEKHIKPLHRDLLAHSEKDAWHRGSYKTSSNSVVAFGGNAQQLGVVFDTATAFDTARLMAELVSWFNAERAGSGTGRLQPLLLIGLWVMGSNLSPCPGQKWRVAAGIPDGTSRRPRRTGLGALHHPAPSLGHSP